jgi:riboflavin kinase/FMN adenylyltransferase
MSSGSGFRVIAGVSALQQAPQKTVVTIGNFDGVHQGHQAILSVAVEQAREKGGVAIAFTFKPHPRLALDPASPVPLLCTYAEKAELLSKAGVDMVIEEPFSREFSTTSPETFFSEVLVRKLNAEAIVVGYDFAFGKERIGGLTVLEAFCKSARVQLTVVPPQRAGSEVVSSSAIRRHLLSGDLRTGNRLLGREFSYTGDVVRGEGRGKKLGFPTANLKLENKLALPYGVYATWAIIDGKRYASVTNVGVRPTFGKEDLPALVECHLLDATMDLYGRSLEVRFVERLREERKFLSIDALKSQIFSDTGQARLVLAP